MARQIVNAAIDYFLLFLVFLFRLAAIPVNLHRIATR